MRQQELKTLANNCAHKLNSLVLGEGLYNEPYTHVVIDDFLPDDVAKMCLEKFSDLSEPGSNHCNDVDIDVIRVLNSAPILLTMPKCLGMPKLMPDPYFSGGGLNVSTKGGNRGTTALWG